MNLTADGLSWDLDPDPDTKISSGDAMLDSVSEGLPREAIAVFIPGAHRGQSSPLLTRANKEPPTDGE